MVGRQCFVCPKLWPITTNIYGQTCWGGPRPSSPTSSPDCTSPCAPCSTCSCCTGSLIKLLKLWLITVYICDAPAQEDRDPQHLAFEVAAQVLHLWQLWSVAVSREDLAQSTPSRGRKWEILQCKDFQTFLSTNVTNQNNEDFTDVTLVWKDCLAFKAHKAILAV